MKARLAVAFVTALTCTTAAQVANDREVLDKIRVEGLQHSQVVRVFETLTVDIGPRLTASPAHKRAVEFVRGELAAIGLSNVRVEPWKFGRGWSLEPLKSLRARRNTIEPVGSIDHLSFIAAGVPGFNPIQDYGNYDVRTHHTNMDTIDRVDEKDIQQAAIVMATFAYHAANLDRKIPHKPR
jgi:hypothetical protein